MTQQLTARQLELRYHANEIDVAKEQLRTCRNEAVRARLLSVIEWNQKQINRLDREAETADRKSQQPQGAL